MIIISNSSIFECSFSALFVKKKTQFSMNILPHKILSQMKSDGKFSEAVNSKSRIVGF